jgi:hypothetical protein
MINPYSSVRDDVTIRLHFTCCSVGDPNQLHKLRFGEADAITEVSELGVQLASFGNRQKVPATRIEAPLSMHRQVHSALGLPSTSMGFSMGQASSIYRTVRIFPRTWRRSLCPVNPASTNISRDVIQFLEKVG